MNRILVCIAVLILLNSCAIPESEQLRKENIDLKAQLETVTQERDALKSQIDLIRKALEAPAVIPDSGAPGESSPSAPAPDSGTQDFGTRDSGPTLPEVAPVNPGNDSGITPAPSETVPETPEQPVTPQSTGPESPGPGLTAPATPSPQAEIGGTAVTTSPLYKYANEVVQAATNYRVQTQQAPPPDCSLGYSAGLNKVERSPQVKRCEVQPLENNQFRVRLESIDGSVVIAP